MVLEYSDGRVCDTPLGLNVPRQTKVRLRKLQAELEEHGRKATLQSIVVHLIETANSSDMVGAFPKMRRKSNGS